MAIDDEILEALREIQTELSNLRANNKNHHQELIQTIAGLAAKTPHPTNPTQTNQTNQQHQTIDETKDWDTIAQRWPKFLINSDKCKSAYSRHISTFNDAEPSKDVLYDFCRNISDKMKGQPFHAEGLKTKVFKDKELPELWALIQFAKWANAAANAGQNDDGKYLCKLLNWREQLS